MLNFMYRVSCNVTFIRREIVKVRTYNLPKLQCKLCNYTCKC